MNPKLLLIVFLLFFQFSYSQTGKFIKGAVSSDSFLLYGVDVINKTTKQFTKTNEKGQFEIAVQAKDSLFFYSKAFYLKIVVVSDKQIELNSLDILLVKKPEELEEVVISKTQSIALSKDKRYEQNKLDEYATEKFDNNEGYQAMRSGKLVNGLNFIAIGKKLIDLFSKDKEKEKKIVPEIEFAVLAKRTCDQKFYLETLKLKPEEIDLFLQFCDTDPKSKELMQNHNVLSMMDFLTVKNKKFQKLK